MFVRSLLAMSLSCILANVAFAAPTTEQALNPKKISAPVQDPIDPLSIERSAASSVVAQPASSVAVQAASEPQVNTGAASAISQKLENAPETTTTTAPTVKVSWTLDSLNTADWYENIGKGQFPVYARAHVMLNNAHASPGAIDGSNGKNTLKAIASFQQMNGLTPTGQ